MTFSFDDRAIFSRTSSSRRRMSVGLSCSSLAVQGPCRGGQVTSPKIVDFLHFEADTPGYSASHVVDLLTQGF
jgi:hypothetical protein